MLLFLKRDVISRVARWWTLIQEFDCTFVYKSGSKMCHVEALSRNPIPVFTNDIMNNDLANINVIDENWLKTVQMVDSEIE